MSKIKTTTSTTRPPDAATGELFFETDTNRLIFWDGSKYHVYNRDSLIQTTGGTDELHYPQGLYSDDTATYYLSQSPMLHFDASHMNGVDKTQLYAHDAWAEYWNDRTQNNYQYRELASGVDAEMDLNQSNLMSGNTNSMPCVKDNGAYWTPTGGAPQTISGDVTTFFVLQPNNPNNYVTPGPYDSWYNNNNTTANQTYTHLKARFGANTGATPNPAWTNTGETSWVDWRLAVDQSTGPGLYIARNSDLGNQVWRPDSRGNHVPMTVGQTSAEGDLSTLGHTYGQWMYEIMFFDTALSIADVNKVKSYLQNKYEGLNAEYFPTGGTIDLTE